MAINPYIGRNMPRLKRNSPTFTRRPDVPRGFPLVGNGLGGFPKRKTEVPDAWTLTVDIDAAGQTWTVDINTGTGIEIVVDWDDGVIEPFTTTGQKDHTYNAPRRYYPRISGKFAASGNIRLGSNSGNRARLKATSLIPLIPGMASFRETFYGCTGITSIPSGLFDKNTLVSTRGFRATFSGCTGITSIPSGLFDKNTLVGVDGFYSTFSGCTGITSIPSGLFDKNTLVGVDGFRSTFSGCTGITSIPSGLFDKNTLVGVDGFRATFYGCTALATIPAALFRLNTLCTSFYEVFCNCNKLQLRADLFFNAGEEGTRFLNQSVDFTNAMQIGTFTGTQGTAPALWTCSFGTGTPTKTGCLTGHTTSSIDNHAAVVADGTWGLS